MGWRPVTNATQRGQHPGQRCGGTWVLTPGRAPTSCFHGGGHVLTSGREAGPGSRGTRGPPWQAPQATVPGQLDAQRGSGVVPLQGREQVEGGWRQHGDQRDHHAHLPRDATREARRHTPPRSHRPRPSAWSVLFLRDAPHPPISAAQPFPEVCSLERLSLTRRHPHVPSPRTSPGTSSHVFLVPPPCPRAGGGGPATMRRRTGSRDQRSSRPGKITRPRARPGPSRSLHARRVSRGTRAHERRELTRGQV